MDLSVPGCAPSTVMLLRAARAATATRRPGTPPTWTCFRACFPRRASSTSSVTGVTWPHRSAAFRSRQATEELQQSPPRGETRLARPPCRRASPALHRGPLRGACERAGADPQGALRVPRARVRPGDAGRHERARERLAEMSSVTVGPDGIARLQDGTELVARTLRPPQTDRVAAGGTRLAITRSRASNGLRVARYARRLPALPAAQRARRPAWSSWYKPEHEGRARQAVACHSWRDETYAITVARELERLGHDVTLAADELGLAADVAGRPGDSGREVDEAAERVRRGDRTDCRWPSMLAAKYPDARRVLSSTRTGGTFAAPARPGVVTRSSRAPTDWPRVRVASAGGAGHQAARADRHGRLPLPQRCPTAAPGVDPEQLPSGGASPGAPGRVGERGGRVRPGGHARRRSSWTRARHSSADIVVGKARAALRNVCRSRGLHLRPVRRGRLGHPRHLSRRSRPTTSPARPPSRPRTGVDLVADLGRYSPEMGISNNELVRSHHGARHHAMELVAVLRGQYLRDPTEGGHRGSGPACSRQRPRGDAQRRILEADERGGGTRREAEARVGEAERERSDARDLLQTKRVRVGLALGRAADRLRSRA